MLRLTLLRRKTKGSSSLRYLRSMWKQFFAMPISRTLPSRLLRVSGKRPCLYCACSTNEVRFEVIHADNGTDSSTISATKHTIP